ncbi:hypothetical protein ABET23_03705 [Bacillus wiedmannii]|uniref:hypothetical protein n=1 Tax=Bacillus wiedmannii TaxID=1890302 RepID=UPI003D2619B1
MINDKTPLPDYKLPNRSKDVDSLLAGLRTDLDSFHDSEINTLIRAGEIRMDIALRSLISEYMENINTVPTPVFPSEDMDDLEKILRRGGKHRFTGGFFENLHDVDKF